MNSIVQKKIFLCGSPGTRFNALVRVFTNLANSEAINFSLEINYDPANFLSTARTEHSQDYIVCVYQKDTSGLKSWLEAGEQKISTEEIKFIIKNNNKAILSFVMKNYLKLERFTPYWVERAFGQEVDFDCGEFEDIFVGIYTSESLKQINQS